MLSSSSTNSCPHPWDSPCNHTATQRVRVNCKPPLEENQKQFIFRRINDDKPLILQLNQHKPTPKPKGMSSFVIRHSIKRKKSVAASVLRESPYQPLFPVACLVFPPINLCKSNCCWLVTKGSICQTDASNDKLLQAGCERQYR